MVRHLTAFFSVLFLVALLTNCNKKGAANYSGVTSGSTGSSGWVSGQTSSTAGGTNSTAGSNAGGGGGGGGGNGNTGNTTGASTGYTGPLGDVTYLYFDQFDMTDDPTLPHHYDFNGPTDFFTMQCKEFHLTLQNKFNQEVPAIETMVANLSDDLQDGIPGGYYSSGTCSVNSAIGSVTFNSGESAKTVFYQSPISKRTRLTAYTKAIDRSGNSYDVIGYYGVNIRFNSGYGITTGIHLEDLYGMAGSDYDFNDFVLCNKATADNPGILYVNQDEKTWIAFDTGWVSLYIQGTSACENTAYAQVVDENGNPRSGNGTSFSLSTPHGETSKQLFFHRNDRLKVWFVKAAACGGTTVHQTDPDVKLLDRCRTSADEGHHL